LTHPGRSFDSLRPGLQVTLAPGQGGSAGGGDDGVRHPARGGQPEDDPGAHPAAHAWATARAQKLHEYLGYEGQPFNSAQGRLFGTQHVVEYQEETRSHQALTYDRTGAIGTHSLCSVQAWAKSELPVGQALRQPAPLFKKLDERVIEEEYARLEG
jgi:hypothetical protein